MRIRDKEIVLGYTRCTMLVHIPHSNTWIPHSSTVVQNIHYLVFQNADYELMHLKNGNRASNSLVQPRWWEVVCNYT